MSSQEYLVNPHPRPKAQIPHGSVTVGVQVIDSTTRLTIPAEQLMEPRIQGHDHLTAPSFSFLIKHPTRRNLVFDLGLRKDLNNLPPVVQDFMRKAGWSVKVTKNVSEILEEGGVSTSDIEAVIWSHHHFDHVGDIGTFPSKTDIVVGPGFKKHYLPGWPTNENSTLKETCFEGRNMREITFSSTVDGEKGLNIAGFDAVDYFGDGSYYILNSPGHTFGHIMALARVTIGGNHSKNDSSDTATQDTFVLMGGDTCHFVGEFRPTEYRPLPKEIVPSPLPKLYPGACPGTLFQDRIHPKHNAAEPFYEMPERATVELEVAHRSIQKLKQLDAMENVLVIVAHDEYVLDNIDFFPESINDWRQKGYGDKVRWEFLKCFSSST